MRLPGRPRSKSPVSPSIMALAARNGAPTDLPGWAPANPSRAAVAQWPRGPRFYANGNSGLRDHRDKVCDILRLTII